MAAIDACARYLRGEQDLSAPTLRNYFSDLRHFAAYCERSCGGGEEETLPFDPAAMTTPRSPSPHTTCGTASATGRRKGALHRLARIMGPGIRLRVSLDTTMTYVWGTGADLQAAVEEIA
jgi:hypothetical protein